MQAPGFDAVEDDRGQVRSVHLVAACSRRLLDEGGQASSLSRGRGGQADLQRAVLEGASVQICTSNRRKGEEMSRGSGDVQPAGLGIAEGRGLGYQVDMP